MDRVNFESLAPISAILSCLALALTYVGSLYVWTSNLPRDHPLTIKERFRRVLLSCIVSVLFLYQISSSKIPNQQNAYISEWLGIRLKGILAACTLPLFLFMLLFLGPIYHLLLEGGISNSNPVGLKTYLKDLQFWRNYIVAPFSEELVFRSCMLPILIPMFGGHMSALLAPSFFGIAHIHHAWEKYFTKKYPIIPVLLSTLFQAFYTTIFGGLSSWLFLRTGHFISIVICHSFCNKMGFPDIEGAFNHERRLSICAAYIAGLTSFLCLANVLTAPSIYANTLYERAL